MIDLIVQEYVKDGYVIAEKTDNVILKHQEYGDYWIIHECRSFDIVEQEAIYDVSKSSLSEYKDADKNTSLLILLNVDSVDEDLKKRIVDIENDPYIFKKYVLAYSDEAWSKLCPIVSDQNIVKLMIQPDVFQHLKDEDAKEGIGCYHLLYSLAHKLPFVMTDVTPKESAGIENTFIPQDENENAAYEWLQKIDSPKDIDELEKIIQSEISEEDGI